MILSPTTLMRMVDICLILAAITTTSFPALYAFSPWFKTRLGRVIMSQAISFAAAMDATLYFRFWEPTHIRFALLINVLILAAIVVTTSAYTYKLWLYNYTDRRNDVRRTQAR